RIETCTRGFLAGARQSVACDQAAIEDRLLQVESERPRVGLTERQLREVEPAVAVRGAVEPTLEIREPLLDRLRRIGHEAGAVLGRRRCRLAIIVTLVACKRLELRLERARVGDRTGELRQP